MRKQSQSSQGNFFARIAICVSLDETYSDVHTNVKNYLFIFPSLSFKSLCGLSMILIMLPYFHLVLTILGLLQAADGHAWLKSIGPFHEFC
jgi:hypothetical protein